MKITYSNHSEIELNDVVTKTYVDCCIDPTVSTSYDYIKDYSKYQSILKEKELRRNRIDKLYEIFKD